MLPIRYTALGYINKFMIALHSKLSLAELGDQPSMGSRTNELSIIAMFGLVNPHYALENLSRYLAT